MRLTLLLLLLMSSYGCSRDTGDHRPKNALAEPAISAVDNREKEAQALWREEATADADQSSEQTKVLIGRACDGEAEAQYELGLAYLKGADIPTAPAKGVRWLERSSAQNHVPADLALATCLLEGTGVEQNTDRGLAILLRRAQETNAAAFRRLAVAYAGGIGVQRDVEQAAKWAGLTSEGQCDYDLIYQLVCDLDEMLAERQRRRLEVQVSQLRTQAEEQARQQEERSEELAEERRTKDGQAEKERELMAYAAEFFKDANDPRFGDDPGVKKIANTVANFRLRPPTYAECIELISLCDTVLGGFRAGDIAKAVSGSKYLFTNERNMIEAGYVRYGNTFVNEGELADIKRRLAERSEEIRKYREEASLSSGGKAKGNESSESSNLSSPNDNIIRIGETDPRVRQIGEDDPRVRRIGQDDPRVRRIGE